MLEKKINFESTLRNVIARSSDEIRTTKQSQLPRGLTLRQAQGRRAHPTKQDCRAPKGLAMTLRQGSALIMTVVLTVLLAIVAVMFVMVARMDSASTSNIVDSKTLDNAAKSIIEIIGKELVFDTPGVAKKVNEKDGSLPRSQYPQYYDYQDYPDPCDAWLANIEPYDDAGTYKWRQISDITGYLKNRNFYTRDILVRPSGSTVVKDYPEIEIVKATGELKDTIDNANADADGDGIADSKWIEFAGINSSKGKKVFAAIRVIDNCAMLNVNTAYKFDANTTSVDDRYKIDGTSQLQINLEGLLKGNPRDDIDKFHKARGGVVPGSQADWDKYDNDVIRRKYDYPPVDPYLPFDISDELELRYRYCVDSRFAGRLEADANIPATIRGKGTDDSGKLYNTDSGWGLGEGATEGWQDRVSETGRALADSDRRHLLTTYSFDRLIDPNGEKMWNVRSSGSAQSLYERLIGAIDIDHLGGVDGTEMKYHLAQFAANVADRADNDSNISIVKVNGVREFYGAERPYAYISEIARNFRTVLDPNGNPVVYRSYAIELFREFETPDGNDYFDPWRLEITDPCRPTISVDINSNDFQSRGGQFYVMIFEDPCAPFPTKVKFADSPANGAKGVDPAVTLRWPPFFMGYDPNGNPIMSSTYDFYIGNSENSVRNSITPTVSDTAGYSYFSPGYTNGATYYWRVDGKKTGFAPVKGSVWSFTTWAAEPNSVYKKGKFLFGDNTVISIYRPMETGPDIKVDEVEVPSWLTNETKFGYGEMTFKRDMSWGNRVKHIWDRFGDKMNDVSLGNGWDYYSGILNPIQPWHNHFTTVGDVAMIFAKKSIYYEDMGDWIGPLDTEANVRFNIDNPSMQNVFKYITALRSTNDPNERQVRGRININTAPKFVIEQLPWVSKANRQDLKIADAIVDYRDMTQPPVSLSGINYSNRQTATGINDIYESPGFRSVGELLAVINKSGNEKYNIRYCGIDSRPQYGFPDLTFSSMSMDDDVSDDLEEQELIFARISDLATVRSDTFTAYILVRVGIDGPQKRFIAILDRSGVKTKDDKVKVAAFQQVPAAR